MTQKTLPSENLDGGIEKYLSREPSINSNFGLQGLPDKVRSLVGLLLSEENIESWATDKKAFDGKSAYDLLSELDPTKLRANIKQIYDGVMECLAFVTIPGPPTIDQIYHSVRQSQYDQLGLK